MENQKKKINKTKNEKALVLRQYQSTEEFERNVGCFTRIFGTTYQEPEVEEIIEEEEEIVEGRKEAGRKSNPKINEKETQEDLDIALYLAVNSENTDVVKLLLERGANPNTEYNIENFKQRYERVDENSGRAFTQLSLAVGSALLGLAMTVGTLYFNHKFGTSAANAKTASGVIPSGSVIKNNTDKTLSGLFNPELTWHPPFSWEYLKEKSLESLESAWKNGKGALIIGGLLSTYSTVDNWDVICGAIAGKDTVLHLATMKNNEEIVKLLLGKGAKASKRNLQGKKPIDLLKGENTRAIKLRLQRAEQKEGMCIVL